MTTVSLQLIKNDDVSVIIEEADFVFVTAESPDVSVTLEELATTDIFITVPSRSLVLSSVASYRPIPPGQLVLSTTLPIRAP